MARGLGWLDTVTSSQLALLGTGPQLNCHGGLKKDTQSLVFPVHFQAPQTHRKSSLHMKKKSVKPLPKMVSISD